MATGQPPAEPRWDLSRMRTSSADVANVVSTPEEVVLLFGTRQAGGTSPTELSVELTDRIVLSPPAARRLASLLEGVLREYEARFGKLPEQRPQR